MWYKISSDINAPGFLNRFKDESVSVPENESTNSELMTPETTLPVQPQQQQNNPVFTIRNLNTSFGENPILDNVNLEIPERTITAIMGPSGCGKSTLLKTLNAFNEIHGNYKVHPESQVLFGQTNVYDPQTNIQKLRNEMGYVAQAPTFNESNSIFDTIAMPLKLKGINDFNVIQNRVHEALKQAGLWEEVQDRLANRVSTLSGGQKQRLSIARTLALKPKVILMDEPTSALNPKAAKEVEKTIKQLSKNYTIIIVTHNKDQAARLTGAIPDEENPVSEGKVVIMYNGKIEEELPGSKFYEPQTNVGKEYVSGEIS